MTIYEFGITDFQYIAVALLFWEAAEAAVTMMRSM